MIAQVNGNERRLEHQIRRLRNLLADAWRCRRSPNIIRRLESMMLRRWQRLERNRLQYPKPQPE